MESSETLFPVILGGGEQWKILMEAVNTLHTRLQRLENPPRFPKGTRFLISLEAVHGPLVWRNRKWEFLTPEEITEYTAIPDDDFITERIGRDNLIKEVR